MDLSLITIGVLIIIAIFVLRAIIHIVPEYQRLIVFRLGSFEKVAGPGIVLLLPPPIQSVAQTVDLREFVVEIPQQTCITKDNAPISIDFLIYQKVVDPKDSFLNIQNFRQAIQGIATTTLRAVVGNIPLDDVLAKREQINEELRVKLDDITHRWGVKVTNVEIKELTPPRDVQEAMNRQLTAERTRRAVVTEAEGKKASQIHRLLHVTRWRQLLDFDVGDFDAPAVRDVVELHAKLLIYLLALCEHVIQRDVADDGTQRCRRDALDGLTEVLDVQERILRFDHLLIDEEIDRDRRVVLRDAGLLRNLHHELSEIDRLRDALNRGRQQQNDAWAGGLLEASPPEDDQALVLRDDVDDRAKREDQDDNKDPENDESQIH